MNPSAGLDGVRARLQLEQLRRDNWIREVEREQVIAVAVVVIFVSLVVVVGAEIGRRVAERRLGTLVE